MAYAKNFAAAIIINNKPLREFEKSNDRVVRLPFGSEYGIKLFNKSDKWALVQILIDGSPIFLQDYVMRPDSEQLVERFGDLMPQKIKFIEAASNQEGIELDSPKNSTVRIEYQFENSQNTSFFQVTKYTTYVNPILPTYPYPNPYYGTWCATNQQIIGGALGAVCGSNQHSSNTISTQGTPGVSVGGSESTQEFTHTSPSTNGFDQTKYSIDFCLDGYLEQKPHSDIRPKSGLMVYMNKGVVVELWHKDTQLKFRKAEILDGGKLQVVFEDGLTVCYI